MTLYKLKAASADAFAAVDEVFPGVQLGKLEGGTTCLVINGLVAVRIDENLQAEFSAFYNQVWGPSVSDRMHQPAVTNRYNVWLNELEAVTVGHVPASRASIAALATGGPAPPPPPPLPPPPPNRPNLTPGGPHPPVGPPTVYGHLPFTTTTLPNEKFFRCEAWPTSKRLVGNVIKGGTFASPMSERIFLPTGFAAVARNALPSFFPACFQYELTPQPILPDHSVDIRCGAIVPMNGQSGGGVEVMFLKDAQNPTALTVTALLPPL
ncbi:MAG TPA: hypothetical protein VFF19_00350 [Reyranella sp.]|jgi:hypothetical protein|nr:hypothetical protein [Reyranella sp.]